MAVPMKLGKRLLSCRLTPEELRTRGNELAHKVQEIDAETSQQAVTKSEMSARLKHLNAEKQRLAMVVSRGEEMRSVEIESSFNEDEGLIIERRMDTMEMLGSRVPDASERQRRLDDTIVVAEGNKAEKELFGRGTEGEGNDKKPAAVAPGTTGSDESAPPAATTGADESVPPAPATEEKSGRRSRRKPRETNRGHTFRD